MLRSGWRKWADEKIGLHFIVVAKGAQKRRNHMRPSHGCGGSGKGGRGTKSHANFAWLCPLRGRKRARSHMNVRMLQRCPHPRTGGSPPSSPGNSKALLRVFPPHRLGRFTSWCAPCHGCGDREERKEQQRLWRPRGAKAAHVLKLRSRCGDPGRGGNEFWKYATAVAIKGAATEGEQQ